MVVEVWCGETMVGVMINFPEREVPPFYHVNLMKLQYPISSDRWASDNVEVDYVTLERRFRIDGDLEWAVFTCDWTTFVKLRGHENFREHPRAGAKFDDVAAGWTTQLVVPMINLGVEINQFAEALARVKQNIAETFILPSKYQGPAKAEEKPERKFRL